MNTFDVRSLGWVVTRDICSEIARVALGGRRRISPEALRALGDRWRAVHASLPVDMPGRLDASIIEPLATSLSKRETAVAEFVEQLLHCWPHLYSERALRNRCLSECVRLILSLALGAIIISCTPADIPIMRDSALVLFAIACWSVMTTIQLWRTHLLVRRMSEQRRCPPIMCRPVKNQSHSSQIGGHQIRNQNWQGRNDENNSESTESRRPRAHAPYIGLRNSDDFANHPDVVRSAKRRWRFATPSLR